ncbi:hypothetical protein D3C83_177070 [compost metagenome]
MRSAFFPEYVMIREMLVYLPDDHLLRLLVDLGDKIGLFTFLSFNILDLADIVFQEFTRFQRGFYCNSQHI